MISRYLILWVVLLLCLGAGVSMALTWEGPRVDSEHFTIYYHPEDEQAARGLLQVADWEYDRITDIIGHRPTERIEVFLARDREEFKRLTMDRIPEWGIGAAVPGQSRIVLISPRYSRGDASLRQILAHELSHVILGQAMGRVQAPRWLDEGLAMYISHEWKLDQSVLVARTLLFDSLIPLDEISWVNDFGQARADLAYAESFLAVAFIVDRFGEESLRQLVRELARDGDIDLAMGITLGLTYREFQLLWQDEVTHRFNWASIISHPIVLWTFMLTLFLAVFIIKRRRARRTLERWQREEDGPDMVSMMEDSPHRWSDP